MIRLILMLILISAAPLLAAAHEVKPAYLDIEQSHDAAATEQDEAEKLPARYFPVRFPSL